MLFSRVCGIGHPHLSWTSTHAHICGHGSQMTNLDPCFYFKRIYVFMAGCDEKF
jgi:hypothetical protein